MNTLIGRFVFIFGIRHSCQGQGGVVLGLYKLHGCHLDKSWVNSNLGARRRQIVQMFRNLLPNSSTKRHVGIETCN